MAIIKLGVMVAGIRGTIGGVTFSANKSGPHAQIWARGSNPKTALQTAQRARLAAIPQAWRDISTANKSAWDTFAALPAQDLINSLGETYSISGYAWFTKVNTRLLAMGRAVRETIPTQSRPSPPTISDVEFPYDTAQSAFVTYPAAEFDPDFDLVLEVAQAGSIGRASPPTDFAEFAVLQNPNDTAVGFMDAYVNRLGIGNGSLKGFVRLYRQTTDGLRSAAASASFVATDEPNYVATAKDYDGTTNYALRGADLTGNVNTKLCTFACWFRLDGGDGTERHFLRSSGGFFTLMLIANNRIRIRSFANDSSNAGTFTTTQSFTAGAAWHHILFGYDNAADTIRCTVDGIAEPLIQQDPLTDKNIDWTRAQWAIGAAEGGAAFMNGCMAELYFSTDKFLDPTDPAVIANFISPAGLPVFLGTEGQLPSNTVPAIYMQAVDPAVNLGAGGNFVNQAALSACSDAP